MQTLIISLENTIKFDQLENLLSAIKTHLDFYIDQEPDIMRVSEDSLMLRLNKILSNSEMSELQESIEIDMPFVQVSFTNKF
jgi:hypothetical protein